MYAIIRAGGKQAKVHPGDVIDIERIKNASDSLTFVPLLVVDDQGATVSDRSVLAGATVVAEVLGETQGDKIDIFKYKNKSGYRRRMGHRQKYTQIKVLSIDLPKPKAKAKAKASAETPDKTATEEAAPQGTAPEQSAQEE